MGRKTNLKPGEKQRIAECLPRGKNSSDIWKLLHRDHRRVERFIENCNKVRGISNKEKFWKISRRKISWVKKSQSKSAKTLHDFKEPWKSFVDLQGSGSSGLSIDGWVHGWLLNATTPQTKIRRQEGSGGVMHNRIVSPVCRADGLMMCAELSVDS